MSWWESATLVFFLLVVFSFIAGFIDVALEERRREKEMEERKQWQSKRKEAADSER
ncbi:hypothetical protein LCGC14_1871680 [marine sediment metagenome]|uniref:Uncharacterized protein n=1 Tax=marine sediment metagenome TaxID=412755 RepID=A0A0F9IIU0_9ZZZZ